MPYKDIAKKREAQKRYRNKRYAENPEYREKIKKCTKENYYKNPEYQKNKNRERLALMRINYKRDHANQMKQPSIDRINPRGNYIFGNCRFIEQSENRKRVGE